MKRKSIILLNALMKKYPSAKIAIRGDAIVSWEDSLPQPDEVEVEELYFAEVKAMAAVAYKEKRLKEYPSIGDQLDAIWKGGQDMEAMRQQILAVKAKHPKP